MTEYQEKQVRRQKEAVREACAKICESMAVVGRAQSASQAIACKALLAAAENIRNDQVFHKVYHGAGRVIPRR